MTREEYEAAVARSQAELDAEKARVFAGRVPGVEIMPADPAAEPQETEDS